MVSFGNKNNNFDANFFIKKGRTTGIEPANAGITTQCLNHLATLAYTVE
jgi:hypothetical protein